MHLNRKKISQQITKENHDYIYLRTLIELKVGIHLSFFSKKKDSIIHQNSIIIKKQNFLPLHLECFFLRMFENENYDFNSDVNKILNQV